ncbi:MAG: hypothetical protein IKR00_05330 [Lachnospiraceae bacterium]|nr:hypothetical protein [Lachnospiraceae bacterium]
MKTKAQLFALTGETFSAVMAFRVMAFVFFKRNEMILPSALWVILFAAVSLAVFIFMLRKERSLPVTAAVAAALFAAHITAYLVLYTGQTTFGFVVYVIIQSGFSVFFPLYHCLHEQTVTIHLTVMDIYLLALGWMFLTAESMGTDTVSVICAAAVLVIDVSGAIGLRMSDGGTDEGTGKAFALAFASAGVVAAAVVLLISLFSRSAGVTDAVVSGIRSAVAALWRLIESFIDWLASLISPPDPGEISIEALPSGIEAEEELLTANEIDPTLIFVIIGVAAAVAAVIIVIKFRREKTRIRFSDGTRLSIARTKKKKRAVSRRFAKLLEELRFRKNAFLNRNTPPGVLLWLEKKADKRKAKRQYGESIREFAGRMAPAGELEPLVNDMERCLYGAGTYLLSAAECRKLKKNYKKISK